MLPSGIPTIANPNARSKLVRRRNCILPASLTRQNPPAERNGAYRPATTRAESSPIPFAYPPPPVIPAIVRCMSVHSDSLGSAMSPMS